MCVIHKVEQHLVVLGAAWHGGRDRADVRAAGLERRAAGVISIGAVGRVGEESVLRGRGERGKLRASTGCGFFLTSRPESGMSMRLLSLCPCVARLRTPDTPVGRRSATGGAPIILEACHDRE